MLTNRRILFIALYSIQLLSVLSKHQVISQEFFSAFHWAVQFVSAFRWSAFGQYTYRKVLTEFGFHSFWIILGLLHVLVVLDITYLLSLPVAFLRPSLVELAWGRGRLCIRKIIHVRRRLLPDVPTACVSKLGSERDVGCLARDMVFSNTGEKYSSVRQKRFKCSK